MTAHQSALTRLLDWAAGQIAALRASHKNLHTGEIYDEEIREEVKQVEDDIAFLSSDRKYVLDGPGMKINAVALRQWEWVERMGWHNKTPLEYTALIGSEVGEATNECRSEVPSERLGEELADVVLRVADMAVQFGIDLEGEIDRKMAVNEERGTRGREK